MPLPLLASGRDADVYAMSADRVLRRYRDRSDAAAEAAVMAHVRHHGVPVPAVYRAAGPELEMERVDGVTMLHALTDDELRVDDAAAILAGLHHRLHTAPPMIDTTDGYRVLHLDLHPDNILLGADGPVLIDWSNATDGPPDLDVALSALILAQVATGTISLVPHATDSAAAMAADILGAFLAHVGGDPGPMVDRATTFRAGDPNLSPAEQHGLAAASALLKEKIRSSRPSSG